MAAVMPNARIFISDQTVREVQNVSVPAESSVVIAAPDGSTIQLPDGVGSMLLQALEAVAHSGEVTIARVPDELTSTAAADLLGVSRPTLMKWAADGKIPSFKVGTHTRFKRTDVVRLRSDRAAERQQAFDAMRALEWENREVLGD